jgi:hypothetical protein
MLPQESFSMTHPQLSRPLFAASAVVGMLLSAATPASAAPADGGGDRMNLVIIYGNDQCPVSKGDEITVCARKDEGERYRIPAPFRTEAPSTKNEAWTSKVLAYESVGATGAQSCSATGAGGWTGCEAQFIHKGVAERKASDVQFSTLIEAERQKRLSKIDAQAAQTQSDVEDAERAYDARKAAKPNPNSGDAAVTAPQSAPTGTPSGGK